MPYNIKPYEDDDVMTIEEFIDCCQTGDFIDYDGYCCPVKDGLIDETREFYPSERKSLPKDATHIVWYNR
jgi:hypothetical protein